MSRYYFELSDGDCMRYLCASDVKLVALARRIWQEGKDGTVTYIKLKSRCIST